MLGRFFSSLSICFLLTPFVFSQETNTSYYLKTGIDLYKKLNRNEIEYDSLYSSQVLEGSKDTLNAATADIAERLCDGCELFQRNIEPSDVGTILKDKIIPKKYLNPEVTVYDQKSLSEMATQTIEYLEKVDLELSEQTKAYRDISGVGLYMDGDTYNSDFDLLDDIARINEGFYEEPPEIPELVNSNSEDADFLILGSRGGSGSYGYGGANYNVDLAGEVRQALFGENAGRGPTAIAGGNEGGTCDGETFCVDVEFISSSHELLGGSGQGIFGINNDEYGNTYEGMYQKYLKYMTNISKKNLYPAEITKNFMQFLNGQNLNLSEIFSTGIIVETRPPSFLDGYSSHGKVLVDTTGEREGSQEGSSSSSAEEEGNSGGLLSKDQADVLEYAFQQAGFDSYSERNQLLSKKRNFADSAIFNNARDNNYLDIVNKLAIAAIEANKDANSFVLEPVATEEYHEKTFNHMERYFEELYANINTIARGDKDLQDLLKYTEEKDES